MKILWASHSAGLGGAERSIIEACSALSFLGHDVHVMFPTDGPLVAEARDTGVATSVVRYLWWLHREGESRHAHYETQRALLHLWSLPRLLHLFQGCRPDVVVTNTVAIPAPAVCAALLRIPHVWFIHEFGREDHQAVFDYGEQASLRLVDRLSGSVIVNSEAVKRKYAPLVRPDKLSVVRPIALSPGGWAPSARPSSSLNLVMVGRVYPGKGHADAIRATARLEAHGIAASLTIVGSELPEYGRQLRQLVTELNLTERVVFHGPVPDPCSLFRNAHVALMCSPSEAFGRVTVEAMRCGLTVIGAAGGATPELIRHGHNGLLYPPGDVDALTGAISTLWQDDEARRRMGANARSWALETFTPEAFAAELLAALQRAIAQRARSIPARRPEPQR